MQALASAFNGYRKLEDKVGDEVLEKYFPSNESYGRYLAMKAYIGGAIYEQTAAQYFANDCDIKPLQDASLGRFNWKQFKPGAKIEKVDSAVGVAILKSMRKHTGSDGWFTGINSSLSRCRARTRDACAR